MPRWANNLDKLEAAILMQHKCRPVHRATVPVHVKTRDSETLWKGHVEIFDIMGHVEAKTCYAWQHIEGNGKEKIFAIMENQVICSAKRAVQAAIFVDEQRLSFG